MNLHLRTQLAVAVFGAALLAVPAAADAAKVKIGGGTIAVNDDGVAAIKLKNPNRSAAKGRLTLKSGGQTIGSRSFKVRARRSARVKVAVTHVEALQILAQGDGLRTTAVAKVKRRGTARKSLVLFYPGASSGGGEGSSGGGGGSTGGGGGSTGGGQQQSGRAWSEGRWQGTWETTNADLAFNITGTRLYTGPFDSFFITANCADGDIDSTAMEPIEATISPNGDFSGSGVYRPSPEQPMPWTLRGHVSGTTLTGTLSVDYTSGFHGHCSGSAKFRAAWYGDYTL
jgi:hypothetical protein